MGRKKGDIFSTQQVVFGTVYVGLDQVSKGHGGYKLSALEIENKLLDHPAIAEVAVLGIEDRTWGEAVAAVVVLKSGGELTLAALKDWCDGKLSAYKIPKKFLLQDSLPRNAMGKVTKPALKAHF